MPSLIMPFLLLSTGRAVLSVSGVGELVTGVAGGSWLFCFVLNVHEKITSEAIEQRMSFFITGYIYCEKIIMFLNCRI